MAYQFNIESQALKRHFGVYVVIANGDDGVKLYVGKTGDNREGCNPIISRCENHFSYNKIHSQVRNKLEAHEDWSYTYVFDHFDEYADDNDIRRICINRINEMERWLNQKTQELAGNYDDVEVLNPYKGVGHLSAQERQLRERFRLGEAEAKLEGIIEAVKGVIEYCR